MKLFKKAVSVVLTLTVVLGLTACGSKLSHKDMVNFLEKEKYECCDEPDDYIGFFGKIVGEMAMDEGAYINCTKRDAQDIYDIVFNHLGQYPDYDVTEATTFCYCGEDGGTYLGFLFTFEEAKKAEKLYKKYSKNYDEDGESGTKGGITYTIECSELITGRQGINGIYLKDDTLLIIRGTGEETKPVDDLCKTFGLISPSTVED